MLCSCDYDVLVFSETWLREDINSSEISSEYILYRCDRNASTSQHTRGGGVLIAVKNCLCSELVPLCNTGALEQVAARVGSVGRSLYIVATYLPPNSSAELYAAHAESVQLLVNQTSRSDVVVSLGDFNLPNLQWHLDEEVNGYITSNATSESEQCLTETLFAAGLCQVNSFINVNGRLLDLAFVSLPELLDVVEPPTPLMPVDNHHVPFVLLIELNEDNVVLLDDQADSFNFDFNACDYVEFNAALAHTNWDALVQSETVDNALSIFYDKLYAICNEIVPPKRRSPKSAFNQPWWTSELRHLRNQLRKSRQRFFSTKSEYDRIVLREMESSYKTAMVTTRADYISRIQSSVKLNPARFWDYVKKQKSSNRIPSNVSFDGVHATSNQEAANLFASFFESVFTNDIPAARQNRFDHIPSHDINFPLIQFSVNEVLSAINDIDSSKGPGTDGIPPLLLKNCGTELASPITILFNRSLREARFPTAWKTAYIVPIHKSGNVNRVSNYRGVSILCSLSKIFEKLVHSVLYSVAAPLISESQHGFMKKRSTTTNLMSYVTFLSRHVEMRKQVDAVYIDFAKAFDTVPHSLVVDKFQHIGFPTWFTEWISSYLSDRNSYVAVNIARSHSFNVTSGVPQGSILGPLIFNVFVNDLCLRLSSFKLSFADDLKFYRVILSPTDCAALQDDITDMLLWCNDNGMRVNSKKCKIISFTRSTNPVHHRYIMGAESLDRVTSICDLGVVFDAKLRFNEHAGIMTAKAFSMLGFIRRHAADFTDIYALKTLYCSLVRSILEYASPVWCPYYVTHIVSLERVQRKFIRFALRLLPWNDPNDLPPYPNRCQLIGLETLSVRRVKMQRMFIFDVIEGVIDCPGLLEQISFNVPPRRFRNSNLLSIPYHRTNYGYNNPLDSCIRAFNEISGEFDFNMSRHVFKCRINV